MDVPLDDTDRIGIIFGSAVRKRFGQLHERFQHTLPLDLLVGIAAYDAYVVMVSNDDPARAMDEFLEIESMFAEGVS